MLILFNEVLLELPQVLPGRLSVSAGFGLCMPVGGAEPYTTRNLPLHPNLVPHLRGRPTPAPPQSPLWGFKRILVKFVGQTNSGKTHSLKSLPPTPNVLTLEPYQPIQLSLSVAVSFSDSLSLSLSHSHSLSLSLSLSRSLSPHLAWRPPRRSGSQYLHLCLGSRKLLVEGFRCRPPILGFRG